MLVKAPPAHIKKAFPKEVKSVGVLAKELEQARKQNAMFLQASTSEAYGDPLVHPQREDYWGNVNSIGPRGWRIKFR